MAVGDDIDKVPVGFTRERGRGRWWYERTKKMNKKDNFGKALDTVGNFSTKYVTVSECMKNI